MSAGRHSMITGKTLIERGYEPGRWSADVILGSHRGLRGQWYSSRRYAWQYRHHLSLHRKPGMIGERAG